MQQLWLTGAALIAALVAAGGVVIVETVAVVVAGPGRAAGRTRRRSGCPAQSWAAWCSRSVALFNCIPAPSSQSAVVTRAHQEFVGLQGKIKSLEQIYLFSLPVKEYQIVETFLGSALKDDVMQIMPVQKQTRAGQRTRFKVYNVHIAPLVTPEDRYPQHPSTQQAFVVVGDHNGHVGLGVKCAKEVATAIRGAIILAKMACVPVRRGYWGNKIGAVHTVPTKVSGVLVEQALL